MNTNKKLKVKDIITVTLLALINVVIFFCKLPAVCDAIHNIADACFLFLAGGNGIFYHRNKGTKARSNAHLCFCPGHSGRVSAVCTVVPFIGSYCGIYPAQNGIRKCERSDRKLCYKSGACFRRQHDLSLCHCSGIYGRNGGHGRTAG